MPELKRRYAVGAEPIRELGTHFRVWAPACRALEVVERTSREAPPGRAHALAREPHGYYSGLVPTLKASLSTPQATSAIPLTAKATIENATNEKTRKVDAEALFDQLPVSLIDSLGKQQGKLLATLGPTLNTVKITASQPTAES